MANTFRTIVNNVLVNIGEATIPATQTSVTDTYQLQVCNFVNHIKEEVEDSGLWRPLWQQFNIAYAAGVITQQVKDSVTNGYATSRSKVARMRNPDYGRELALVFDTTSFPLPSPLRERPLADLVWRNTLMNQTTLPYSTDFAVQDLGNDVVNLNVYPAGTSLRTIQATFVVPQPRIDATAAGSATYPWLGTMGLDTPILVPSMAIELGASWYALQERGEELGTGSVFTEERYRRALDDAISRDIGEQGDLMLIVG